MPSPNGSHQSERLELHRYPVKGKDTPPGCQKIRGRLGDPSLPLLQRQLHHLVNLTAHFAALKTAIVFR